MVRDVITVGPDTSVAEAAQLMAKNDVSALPVVDQRHQLVGIISEADLLHRKEIGTDIHRTWWVEALIPATTLAAEFAKSHGRRVEELMSQHLIAATEDTPLAEIAGTLERHRIKRVPITRDGKLVGIVSRANLIQALASAALAPDAGLDKGRTIRHELLSRLTRQPETSISWVLLLAFVALAVILVIPQPAGLPILGQRMLAAFGFVVVVWVTEALDYAISAIVISALMAFLLGLSPDPAKPQALIGTVQD
jgi:CBS domain-containing protein